MALCGVALVAAGCSGDDGDQAATEGSPPEATAGSSVVATPLEVEVTRDVRYHDDIEGLHEPILDVYAPTEAGSWPLVVMLHGGAGTRQDKSAMEPMAQQVASEGAVVFTPTVGGPAEDLQSVPPEIMDGMLTEAACAASFAVENAADYGGDATQFNLYGFSAGAQAVGVVLWGGMTAGEGCLAESAPPTPTTAVLFEGDWFAAPSWDDALESGALVYEDISIWDDLDGAPGTNVVLVVGTDTPESLEHRVPLGDLWSEDDCGAGTDGWVPRGGTCRYLTLRDPDGDYRRDMERLALLDDDLHDVSEYSLILADRLNDTGHPATVISIEGLSHADSDQEQADLVGPVIIEHVVG